MQIIHKSQCTESMVNRMLIALGMKQECIYRNRIIVLPLQDFFRLWRSKKVSYWQHVWSLGEPPDHFTKLWHLGERFVLTLCSELELKKVLRTMCDSQELLNPQLDHSFGRVCGLVGDWGRHLRAIGEIGSCQKFLLNFLCECCKCCLHWIMRDEWRRL